MFEGCVYLDAVHYLKEMRMKFFIIPFFICMLLSLASCTKEKIITVEKEKIYRWKSLEQFSLFSKIQLNSHSNEEHLLITGINTITQITKNTAWPDSIEIQNYSLSYTTPVETKMPITDDIFIGKNDIGQRVFISTCYNLGLNTYYTWIDLPKFDSLSAGVTPINAFRGNNVVLNTASQCLIPYDIYTDPIHFVVQRGRNFLLVNYRVEKDEFDQIQIDSVDKIIFGPETGLFFKIESVDEYFFIVFDYNTYRVDKNRDIHLVLEGFTNDIFRDGQKYVATGASGILYSYDEGLTWQKQTEEIDSFLRYAIYTTIDNKIIGFIDSQIWHFDFGENEITIRELDNDGLEGNKITSISKFENNIYVTSLSGVFKINESDFFYYK